MIKRLVVILGIVFFVSVYWVSAGTSVHVIDKSDDSHVIGATVIDKNGVILGVTDNFGQIDVDADNCYPLTIRCVGYEQAVVASGCEVALVPSAVQLNDVIVTAADRPVKRVLCFAREYSSGISGQDTMLYYCEYMTEAFISEGKVKGYKSSDAKPRKKASRRYAKVVKNGCDSIFSPDANDDVTGLSGFDFMAFLPSEKIDMPDVLNDGAETDTLFGKYGPEIIYKKKNGLFVRTSDALSNHKDRSWSPFIFKLLGMTVDIDVVTGTQTFADNGTGRVDIYDFLCGACYIHMIGRGKLIKKIFNTNLPVELSSYLELYPLEITNCTVEEYKELTEDLSELPFQYPSGLQPLSPVIKAVVEKVDVASSHK